jgi:hypothetical protein
MTLAQCFDSAGKHPAFWRRAAGFTAFVLLLSLPAWSDVYARIEKLGQKCRGGDREACAGLDADRRLQGATHLRQHRQV